MSNLIVQGTFTLQKPEGKGGWTYITFQNNLPKSDNPFGWIIVKGTIDSVPISRFKLWPTKEGDLFLPVKSAIRKKIKKEAGANINIVLYFDDAPLVIPEEFQLCLLEAPPSNAFFQTLSDTSKQQYIDWINAAKHIDTKANRIAKSIQKLEAGLKWHQKLY